MELAKSADEGVCLPDHEELMVWLPFDCGYLGRRAPRSEVLARIERNGLAEIPEDWRRESLLCAVVDDDGSEFLVDAEPPHPKSWAIWGAPKSMNQKIEEAARG